MHLCCRIYHSPLDALKQPETYVALGAGAIGSACGRCAVTGLFVPAAVSAAVGALFITVGITFDAIRAARNPELPLSFGKISI